MGRRTNAMVIGAAFGLAVAGCGAYHMYEGPTRPESAVSVITLGKGVGFVRIDEDGDPGVRSIAYIEPGEHAIGLRYDSHPSCWLNAETRAGARYVAQGTSHGSRFTIELVDTRTHEVVGSCGNVY